MAKLEISIAECGGHFEVMAWRGSEEMSETVWAFGWADAKAKAFEMKRELGADRVVRSVGYEIIEVAETIS